MEDRQKLKDIMAIVNDGRKGVGKSIALGFAAEGANLVACGRTSSLSVETTRLLLWM